MDHGCETYRGFNGYAGDAENRNPVRPDLGELGAVQKDWPGRKVIQNNEKRISTPKTLESLTNPSGRKENLEERKTISPKKALDPSNSCAAPSGQEESRRCHSKARHVWHTKERVQGSQGLHVRPPESTRRTQNMSELVGKIQLQCLPEAHPVQIPFSSASVLTDTFAHGSGSFVSSGAPGPFDGAASRRSTPKLEPGQSPFAPGRDRRDGCCPQDIQGDTSTETGRDHDQQSVTEEVAVGGVDGNSDEHVCDWQRNHRAVEAEGPQPGLCLLSCASAGSCGVRYSCSKDLRGGGQPGAIIPRVGHHDHEGGIMLSATETSGRVGGHARGSSTGDGGEERPPQRRKSPTRASRQDGQQRLRGTPAVIGHHGQFGEPGGDLDQGVECSQGSESQEDTDRRGRGFFERMGQDELDAVGSMIAESMVVTPESSGEHLLGSEYERQRLDSATCERLRKAANRCDPDMFQALVSHGRPLLFEIACSPESRMTSCMQQMCGEPEKARRFAFWNGYDLSTNTGVRGIMSCIEKERPMHVWLSLECGPFSPMQNVNQRSEAQCEDLKRKRAACMRQYVGGLLIYTFCHQLGISCTCEWSEKCNAWRLPMVQRVFNKIRPRFVVTKGCRVGLMDPKTKLLLSKGWKLATTHELLGDRMNMACQGNHEHGVCQGHLARESAYYTEEFVKRACRAILDGVSHHGLWSELRSSQEHTVAAMSCSCEDVCHPASDLQCCVCEMEKHRKDPLCMVGEDGGQVVPFTEAEREKHVKMLYQLHRNTGHGSMHNLVQALRAKQADPRIIELAQELKCSVCEESQRRTPRPMATLEPLPPKWKVVQADCGHWTHLTTKEQVQFIIMVDEGCRFRVGKIVKGGPKRGVPGAALIEFFQEQWKPIFGKPDKLRVDPAGPCRSRELSAYLDTQGIELDIIPAEAHWQLSHAERVIGSVKHVMTLLAREDPTITPEEAFAEALRVGNEKEVVRGYSPMQHALGRSPDASGRLHLSDLDEVPPILCENSGEEFHRNWERMKQAEQAFSEFVYLERLSRAKNSRSYTLKEFVPGDLVYVWRVQDKKGGTGPKKGSFTGPARVLAVETRQNEDGSFRPGSAVWVVRGNRLLKTCPQQLRKASAREQCLEELSQPVDLPWTCN